LRLIIERHLPARLSELTYFAVDLVTKGSIGDKCLISSTIPAPEPTAGRSWSSEAR
jgi:hypothetical protein